MKTKILKWDVTIQRFLLILDGIAILLLLVSPFTILWLLVTQLVCGAVQLTGSGLHLLLQHKSIGYSSLRQIHFAGALLYGLLLLPAYKYHWLDDVWLWALVVIPQLLIFTYFFLCRAELHFLQKREFFILR